MATMCHQCHDSGASCFDYVPNSNTVLGKRVSSPSTGAIFNPAAGDHARTGPKVSCDNRNDVSSVALRPLQTHGFANAHVRFTMLKLDGSNSPRPTFTCIPDVVAVALGKWPLATRTNPSAATSRHSGIIISSGSQRHVRNSFSLVTFSSPGPGTFSYPGPGYVCVTRECDLPAKVPGYVFVPTIYKSTHIPEPVGEAAPEEAHQPQQPEPTVTHDVLHLRRAASCDLNGTPCD
jgi:hypothetical protein